MHPNAHKTEDSNKHLSRLDLINQAISSEISRILELPVEGISNLLEAPKSRDLGDLALPCFPFAKKMSLPPAQVAQKIRQEITLPPEVLGAEAVGAFLNFRFNFELLLPDIISDIGNQKPNLRFPKNETILIEYSSPNIAKPFHVGHLRATLIGNSLDRIYRFSGYNVESVNHLGDWGTQFGFVWAGSKIWGMPEEVSVASLVHLYKKATALKDEEEKSSLAALSDSNTSDSNTSDSNTSDSNTSDSGASESGSVQDMARDYFLQLEAGEPEAVSFWKTCVEVSLKYLKATYDRLDISFDHYLGESFYSDKLENIKKELSDKKLLQESEGALGVQLEDDLGFARVSTPDGRSLYLTRDLAAAIYRYERFKFKKSLYVVGAPQSLHFKQLKAVLGKLGKSFSEDLIHIAFGHVLGMKTRGEGQAIELNGFLDEAKERALQAYRSQVSKRPEGLNEDEVADKVAIAAIIFSTLNRTNIKDVHFSWDEALSFGGDSGPYLLYAYARICGIERKAKENSLSPETSEVSSAAINNPDAKNLAACLMEFDAVVKRTIKSSEPLCLCGYALELAKCVSKGYLSMKVLGEDKKIAHTNLALFKAARETLGYALMLLGCKPLDKM